MSVVLESATRPEHDLTGKRIVNARTRGFEAVLLEQIDGRVYRMRIERFRGATVDFEITGDYRVLATQGA